MTLLKYIGLNALTTTTSTLCCSTVLQNIHDRLKTSLDAIEVEVVDQSGGCGAQYAVRVVSERFRGMSLVAQHRLVNSVLKEELTSGGMHSLRITTKCPPHNAV